MISGFLDLITIQPLTLSGCRSSEQALLEVLVAALPGLLYQHVLQPVTLQVLQGTRIDSATAPVAELLAEPADRVQRREQAQRKLDLVEKALATLERIQQSVGRP